MLSLGCPLERAIAPHKFGGERPRDDVVGSAPGRLGDRHGGGLGQTQRFLFASLLVHDKDNGPAVACRPVALMLRRRERRQ